MGVSMGSEAADARRFMCLKFRDSFCTKMFWSGILCSIVAMIGMSICLAGISKLPKCHYGQPSCYFFVKVCDNKLVSNVQSCVQMPKHMAIEGGDGDGVDQLIVPILASVMGLIPSMTMTMSSAITNQRFLLGLLELGKVFLAFDGVLLVMGVLKIDKLTFDCRWWSVKHHPNGEACHDGFGSYIAGACILFSCQFILVLLSIFYSEIKRRKMADNRLFSEALAFGPTDAV